MAKNPQGPKFVGKCNDPYAMRTHGTCLLVRDGQGVLGIDIIQVDILGKICFGTRLKFLYRKISVGRFEVKNSLHLTDKLLIFESTPVGLMFISLRCMNIVLRLRTG